MDMVGLAIGLNVALMVWMAHHIITHDRGR